MALLFAIALCTATTYSMNTEDNTEYTQPKIIHTEPLFPFPDESLYYEYLEKRMQLQEPTKSEFTQAYLLLKKTREYGLVYKNN